MSSPWCSLGRTSSRVTGTTSRSPRITSRPLRTRAIWFPWKSTDLDCQINLAGGDCFWYISVPKLRFGGCMIRRHGPRLLLLATFAVLVLLTDKTSGQAKHLASPHATVPRQSGPSGALDSCCFEKLLSNEHVRVLRVKMAPHQSTGVDRRPHDYLIIPLQYADMQTVGDGGSFDFEMRAGQMQVNKGGWPHRTVNAADSALDVLEFEIT